MPKFNLLLLVACLTQELTIFASNGRQKLKEILAKIIKNDEQVLNALFILSVNDSICPSYQNLSRVFL